MELVQKTKHLIFKNYISISSVSAIVHIFLEHDEKFNYLKGKYDKVQKEN